MSIENEKNDRSIFYDVFLKTNLEYFDNECSIKKVVLFLKEHGVTLKSKDKKQVIDLETAEKICEGSFILCYEGRDTMYTLFIQSLSERLNKMFVYYAHERGCQSIFINIDRRGILIM